MDFCSTLLIFRKQTPAFFFIAVDLPKAGTFTPFPAVFYEAADPETTWMDERHRSVPCFRGSEAAAAANLFFQESGSTGAG